MHYTAYLALLKASRVRVLGAFTHAELDVDVDPVGLTRRDERRSKPVVDRRDRHVTHGVNANNVAA